MWDWSKRDRLFTLGLFWVALAPRLYVALAWAREPVWDGHYYHFGAMRIASGLGYSEDVMIDGVAHWKPWCHYPVGYSGFLAGLYEIFGSELWVAPVGNALVGALTAVLAHRVARSFLCKWRSRVAAGLCALHPGLILYTALVMTEGLAAFTVLAAGWLAVRFRRRWAGPVASGLALGLGTLVRPTALLAAPFLFFVWPGSWRARAVRSAVAVAVTLASLSPWTWRNCQVMDGCALVSTNGGWNLAIGALADTGRFATLRAEDGCRDVTGQVDQDRCWGRVGRARIMAQPLEWVALMPKKLAHTYNHESFAVGYLAQAAPELWPPERQHLWRTRLTIFHHVLMLAAALSVVSFWRPRPLASSTPFLVQSGALLLVVSFVAYGLQQDESPLYWLIVLAPFVPLLRLPGRPVTEGTQAWLLSLVFLTSLTHAVFFGEDRYHLTISPMLCILAAAALRRPRHLQSGRPPAQGTACIDDRAGAGL